MEIKLRLLQNIRGVLILPIFFLVFSTLAQEGKSISTSLTHQLGQIKGNDQQSRSSYQNVIDILKNNKQEVLLENDAITKELKRLKTILAEKDYYNLIKVYFMSHFNLEVVPNESLIHFAKDFIEANKSNYSYNCKKVLLEVIREGRLPYRNLGQINEGITYYTQLAEYFEGKDDPAILSIIYSVLPGFYSRMGLTEKAEYYVLKSLSYLEDNSANDTLYVLLGTSGKTNRYAQLGIIASDNDEYVKAERYLKLSLLEYQKLKAPMSFTDGVLLFILMGRVNVALEKDSSIYYFNKAIYMLSQYKMADEAFNGLASLDREYYYAWYYLERGKYFIDKKNDSAAYYFTKTKGLKEEKNLGITGPIGELIPNYYAAKVALAQNNPLRAVELLLTEIQELRTISTRTSLLKELELLAQSYTAAGKYKEGYEVQKEVLQLMQLVKQESDAAKTLSFEIERKIQENENDIALLKAKEETNEKVKYYLYGITALLGMFAVTLGIAIFNKQKSNARLASINKEVTDTLEQLKQTQSQLIQSEKMASLGELTAGIAHEIQNPLNFVNNFSEVNTELIDELKKELAEGNKQLAEELVDDIKSNSEKINHHGKRAGDIVKGMLQHSRSSSGVKEPTNINVLCDEYLRLAYHGLRAKDKSFNATMKTEFDETIGIINIVSQDIGRVILNLISNAFYAVNEKYKDESTKLKAEGEKSSYAKASEDKYEPTVSVSTRKEGNKVLISVKDNGNGIPDKIKEKIFQPFFTTKPTGQGTGLGLSLSYDIVKAHGGELKAETKIGEGSEFIIKLPYDSPSSRFNHLP